MTHLGSFAAAVRELDPDAPKDTFEFCRETFTVHGAIPGILMIQLGASATGKIEDSEGLGAIWEAMRCSLTIPEHEAEVVEDDEDGEPVTVTKTVPADPAQFHRFYKLAVANVVGLEELMRLTMGLYEAQAGRPTVEPRGSLAGQRSTSPNSNTSSSTHPAFAKYRPVAEVLAG